MDNEPNSSIKLVDQYEKSGKGIQSHSYTYKDLPIHAQKGLHEEVARQACRFFPENSSILELASGSGAMAQRLIDNEFSVTASDYVETNFRLHDKLEFIQADYNLDFNKMVPTSINCIVALEIIEHLENPRHFLRQCCSIMETGSHMILSTPNIESPVSKALFLRNGFFKWFADEDYQHHGHIMPLSHWVLEKCFQEQNLEIVEKTSVGDPYVTIKNWKSMVILSKLVSIISSPDSEKLDVVLYVLKKK